MDPVNTLTYAAHAYTTATRFVPLVPPPPPPPVVPPVAPAVLLPPPGPPGIAPGAPLVANLPPTGSTPAAGPGGGTVGPRFDLATLTTVPPAPPPAATPAPTPADLATRTIGIAAVTAPPPTPLQPAALPLPTSADLTTAGPPNIATVNRATAAYTQTQQLTGPPAPTQPPTPAAPTAIHQDQPSTLTPVPPPPPTPPVAASEPSTAEQHQVGVVGINSLGGVAASPTHLLGFARGTFLNVLA